jgi:hypothetical protein
MVFALLNAFLPLSISLQAQRTRYPFKLSTTIEKTTYQLREPINITLRLENVGSENVTLEYQFTLFDFIIYDENFRQIYRWGKYVGSIGIWLPPYKMKPGGNFNTTLTWYQSVGFEVIGDVGAPDFEIRYYWAEPGKYYLTGIFADYHGEFRLQTPAVRITII